MIDFSDDGIPFRFFDNTELEETRRFLECHNEEIRDALHSVEVSKIKLGYKLILLYFSKDYAADPFLMCNSLGISGKKKGLRESFAFFSYCEKYFYLDKSQVSRYMNVADEFGDMSCGVKPEWKDFGYSQLVELLPLTLEQRKSVKSDWTVKRIREYKQNPLSCSFERDMVIIPAGRSDLSAYSKFWGMTPKAICDMYFELEKKYNELCKRFNIRLPEDNEVRQCRN